MISVHLSTFWSDEKDKINACKEFMPLVIPKPDAIKEVKENEEDKESNIDLIFQYYDVCLNDYDAWNEIADFARQNEIYVVIYDHEFYDSKGYWYDEQDEWIEQNNGENKILERLID